MPIPPNLLVTAWLLLASPVAISGTPNGDLELALDGRLDRGKLIAAILARNPGLQAAREAWEAARQRPDQARSLDDPMLSYQLSPRSAFADGVRYGQVLRYSQRLPFPGTLRLRGEVAELEARAAGHDLDALRLSLATLASRLYDDLYLAVRAAEINEEHIALLESFQRIATARYAAGEAPQQAPLQAEVELAHLLHQRVVLETERVALTSRMNALLHREPGARLPSPPASLGSVDLLAEPTAVAALTAEALENRPELRAADAELEARRAEVELAQLAFKPDFELMGSFNSMWSESAHRTMVGVGVNLPIRRQRLRAARAEAEARVSEQRHQLDQLADEVRSEVAVRAAELAEARHVVELYRSRLIPAAGDQVEAALAGFRTGQNSFLALIEAERSQRTVRLGYERALAELSRSRAELERATGRGPGVSTSTATEAPRDEIPRDEIPRDEIPRDGIPRDGSREEPADERDRASAVQREQREQIEQAEPREHREDRSEKRGEQR